MNGFPVRELKSSYRTRRLRGLGFRSLRVEDLGLSGFGFKGLGFRGLGCGGLGLHREMVHTCVYLIMVT